MIGPIRIAEIERAVGEGAALQRLPHRAGQVRAGFQNNGDVGGAGGVEVGNYGRPLRAMISRMACTSSLSLSRQESCLRKIKSSGAR